MIDEYFVEYVEYQMCLPRSMLQKVRDKVGSLVDDTGIEPVTPSMSRKCATAAPIVRSVKLLLEVGTGFEPV